MKRRKKIGGGLEYHDIHGFIHNYDSSVGQYIDLNLQDGLWRLINLQLERIINEIDVAVINDLIIEKGFQEDN